MSLVILINSVVKGDRLVANDESRGDLQKVMPWREW